MERTRHVCVALFGGTGERFGAPYPKQFVLLDDEPMILVTLKALIACPDIDEIYIVTEPKTRDQVYSLVMEHRLHKIEGILNGGATRQESSRLAMEFLLGVGVPRDAIVLICDGDRPCVDPDLVHRCYAKAEECGAAVTAIPMTESVLLGDKEGNVDRYLDRDYVYAVQTPQAFRFSLIYRAHMKFADKRVTDDASLVTYLGKPVGIVAGSRDNIKITVPQDVDTYRTWKTKVS